MDTLSGITLSLAVATVWLGFATWKMAKISAKQLELETHPYFAFKNFFFEVFKKPSNGKMDLRIGLVFSNPGKVPIHYEEKSLHVHFKGKTTENIKRHNHGSEIYPQDVSTFWCGTIQDIDMAGVPGKGLLEYEVDYFSMPEREKGINIKKKIEYTIHSLDPFFFDWIYLSE